MSANILVGNKIGSFDMGGVYNNAKLAILVAFGWGIFTLFAVLMMEEFLITLFSSNELVN